MPSAIPASAHTVTLSDDELQVVLGVIGTHCFKTGRMLRAEQVRFASQYGALKLANRDMYAEINAVMWRLMRKAQEATRG